MPNRKFVFDFDSTLTSVEGLDVLAEISLKDNPEREEVVKKIQEITDLGIDGDISFTDSLSRRIALLKANKSQLAELIDLLKTKLSSSVEANREFFDDAGTIVGFDEANPLSQHNGKVNCLKGSGIEGEIQIIGDGYSDFVMRREGVADKFFAYTENVSRKKATDNADHVVASLDEFLTINQI